jgi:hypothetical protein
MRHQPATRLAGLSGPAWPTDSPWTRKALNALADSSDVCGVDRPSRDLVQRVTLEPSAAPVLLVLRAR